MNTLAERLQEALKRKPNLSQAGLAKACEVKPPSVTDWLSGRTKKIEGANLLMAAQFLDVNPWWLATGKGPIERDGSIPDVQLAPPPSWPLKVSLDLFMALPPDERERIDDDVTHAVERWHKKNHMKSRKVG